ncbi:MAG: hypothetical protein ABI720_01765, partial [Actinomycetes bacterium]
MSQSDRHAPDDLLALHATGDPLPEATGRHVASCSQCQTELGQWSALVATGRSVRPEDVPGEPSAAVWGAINAELGLGVQPAGAPVQEPLAEVVSIDAGRRW